MTHLAVRRCLRASPWNVSMRARGEEIDLTFRGGKGLLFLAETVQGVNQHVAIRIDACRKQIAADRAAARPEVEFDPVLVVAMLLDELACRQETRPGDGSMPTLSAARLPIANESKIAHGKSFPINIVPHKS